MEKTKYYYFCNSMSLLISIPVVLCVVVAAVTDILHNKIPNWLTLSSALLALLLNFFLSGIHGLVWSILGIGTGFSLLFLLYL